MYDVTRKKSDGRRPEDLEGERRAMEQETSGRRGTHRRGPDESARGRAEGAKDLPRGAEVPRAAQREVQAPAARNPGDLAAAGRGATPGKRSTLERAAAKVERVAAKVDGALAAEAAKQEKLAARAEEQAAKLDRLAGYLGAIDVWTRVEPGGRRPRFTREDIADAAIRIADQEGIDALSMRHLAAELGAGTMTLYHYVRTKDELMTLVTDAIMGEVVLPPDVPLPSDWKEACTLLAHRSLIAMRRHPWMLDIADDPPLGPNSVRHFDQTLAAVSSLDISLADRLDIVTAIDEYVFGYILHERNHFQDDASAAREMLDYVRSLLATGDYPELEELAATMGLDAAWNQIAEHQRDATRFDRNLRRLLHGIEAALPPGATDTDTADPTDRG